MVNNMALVYIIPQRETLREENGKKARELDGLAMMTEQLFLYILCD
jgi:hypothetical protein